MKCNLLDLNKKLSRGWFAVRTVSKELNLCLTRSVYFALIESHLRYGVCFWGTCSGYLFNSVFVLQKRAIRFICEAENRDSCGPLFLRHKILTWASIFILETVCLVKKKVGNRVFPYPLRNTHSVTLPIPTSSLTRDSIFYNGRKLLNSLPITIRQIQNFQTFKREVRKRLVAKAYYSVDEFFADNFRKFYFVLSYLFCVCRPCNYCRVLFLFN